MVLPVLEEGQATGSRPSLRTSSQNSVPLNLSKWVSPHQLSLSALPFLCVLNSPSSLSPLWQPARFILALSAGAVTVLFSPPFLTSRAVPADGRKEIKVRWMNESSLWLRITKSITDTQALKVGTDFKLLPVRFSTQHVHSECHLLRNQVCGCLSDFKTL